MLEPFVDGFDVLAEGPLRTERLRLHHLHTRPRKGTAARLLFLGGSNFDLRLKREILRSALPERFEILTYEPRGIGRSDRPEGDWTMSDYAADARAVMDAVGWDRAVMIGESFGGMTALHLALSAPERVDCMVVSSANPGGMGGASYDISTFLDLSRDDAARRAMILQDRRNGDLEKTDPATFSAKLAARTRFETEFASGSNTSGGYARLLAARAGHDVWDRLDALLTPTLVLAGTHDDQAPIEAQRRMAERLPNATFMAHDGGHGVLFAKRELLAEICQNWILPRLSSR